MWLKIFIALALLRRSAAKKHCSGGQLLATLGYKTCRGIVCSANELTGRSVTWQLALAYYLTKFVILQFNSSCHQSVFFLHFSFSLLLFLHCPEKSYFSAFCLTGILGTNSIIQIRVSRLISGVVVQLRLKFTSGRDKLLQVRSLWYVLYISQR